MYRLFLACCIGLLGLSAPVKAEPPLTLDWAIQEAIAHNPKIEAARMRWEAETETAPQVRSPDDPSLYTMFWAVPDNTPNPFSAREIWFGIKQRLPFPGKLDLKGQVAENTAAMAEQRYHSVQEDVVQNVKTAYYDLFLIHQETGIMQKHLDLTRKFADIAQARYATNTAGGASQGDVLKALVEISDLSNRIQVLHQRQRAVEARLNTLLNRAPESPLGIPEAFPVAQVRHSLADMKQMALVQRSELAAVGLAIERAKISRALAKKDYYPDFMTDFSYWNVKNNTNRWMLMVEAKVPIAFWSKGKHDARVQQAEIEQRAWEADYRELQNQILFAVEDAYADVQAAQENMTAYAQTIIPQAQQSVDALRAGYETNRATFLNLIDSERMLLRFELDYYRAMVNFEKGIAKLERAMGAPLRGPAINEGESR